MLDTVNDQTGTVPVDNTVYIQELSLAWNEIFHMKKKKYFRDIYDVITVCLETVFVIDEKGLGFDGKI